MFLEKDDAIFAKYSCVSYNMHFLFVCPWSQVLHERFPDMLAVDIDQRAIEVGTTCTS